MSHRLKILGISENQNEAYTVSLLSYLYVLLEFLLKEPQKPIPSDSSLTFCGLFSHKDQNVRLRFDDRAAVCLTVASYIFCIL